MDLRQDCDYIIKRVLDNASPCAAVAKALADKNFPRGRLILIAIGKAAWTMSHASYEALGNRITGGAVITKYGHLKGPIGSLKLFEAGHPVPDENTYAATKAALKLTEGLNAEDTVLFLVSGGGSSLFENPLIAPEELQDITSQMLKAGCAITEINTIRKRLSAVKGGRFAEHCSPARIFSVVLSDIIGDPLDMIASGPAYPDSTTAKDALRIAAKYQLRLSQQAKALLYQETPKSLDNVETVITGSVRELCREAALACSSLGYEPLILTDSLDCEAKEAGSFLAAIARSYRDTDKSLAFIAGGETVVHVRGSGRGGRNQELSLSAACGIAGLKNCAVFSCGSDGTDGPTDAAGGFVSGNTLRLLQKAGIDIYRSLSDNDSYSALAACGGLIITGPTGTNINDISVLLIRPSIDHCSKTISKYYTHINHIQGGIS